MERRNSYRWPTYDYASLGYYFVTIVTEPRRPLFGAILRRDPSDPNSAFVHHSVPGEIAVACWLNILEHFTGISLDEFVVMPDHVHGVLQIQERDPLAKKPAGRPGAKRGALGTIIGSYKAAVSKEIHRNTLEEGPIWHRDFHDRVIRSEDELFSKRAYVQRNPLRWELRRAGLT